jgi:hypothetical protein
VVMTRFGIRCSAIAQKSHMALSSSIINTRESCNGKTLLQVGASIVDKSGV